MLTYVVHIARRLSRLGLRAGRHAAPRKQCRDRRIGEVMLQDLCLEAHLQKREAGEEAVTTTVQIQARARPTIGLIGLCPALASHRLYPPAIAFQEAAWQDRLAGWPHPTHAPGCLA